MAANDRATARPERGHGTLPTSGGRVRDSPLRIRCDTGRDERRPNDDREDVQNAWCGLESHAVSERHGAGPFMRRCGRRMHHRNRRRLSLGRDSTRNVPSPLVEQSFSRVTSFGYSLPMCDARAFRRSVAFATSIVATIVSFHVEARAQLRLSIRAESALDVSAYREGDGTRIDARLVDNLRYSGRRRAPRGPSDRGGERLRGTASPHDGR